MIFWKSFKLSVRVLLVSLRVSWVSLSVSVCAWRRKSRGPKSLQPEVWSRRTPRLLVHNIYMIRVISQCILINMFMLYVGTCYKQPERHLHYIPITVKNQNNQIKSLKVKPLWNWFYCDTPAVISAPYHIPPAGWTCCSPAPLAAYYPPPPPPPFRHYTFSPSQGRRRRSVLPPKYKSWVLNTLHVHKRIFIHLWWADSISNFLCTPWPHPPPLAGDKLKSAKNSKWAKIESQLSRWHSVVRVAGFKPVGAERRSGSIPPSGRH